MTGIGNYEVRHATEKELEHVGDMEIRVEGNVAHVGLFPSIAFRRTLVTQAGAFRLFYWDGRLVKRRSL